LRIALTFVMAVALQPVRAYAEKRVESFDKEFKILQEGGHPAQHIGDAQFRVAVFSYEDLDRTGLGNSLAGVVGRTILFGSQVSSLGVIRYEAGLAPSPESAQWSYFDKVDRVAEAQDVSLSVWGSVRAKTGRLLVDTYVQVPPKAVRKYFQWSVPLRTRSSDSGGERSGAGSPSVRDCGQLVAHLSPNRIVLQQVELPSSATSDLQRALEQLDNLREGPSESAPVRGRLPLGETYQVVRRSGDWFLLRTPKLEGWVPRQPKCETCPPITSAAQYTSQLVGYMAARGNSLSPLSSHLGTEALALVEEITALDTIVQGKSTPRRDPIALANRWYGSRRWTGRDPTTGIDRGRGIPPGNAAFANVRALGKVAGASEKLLNREQITEIAFELAEAAHNDPGNLDVLRNLDVLFRCTGDNRRADVAKELLEKRPDSPLE
jgi:hypothetical protein